MNITLKNLYVVGRKLREDGFGILHEGTLKSSGVTISIRAYHHQFCHPSVVEKIQAATLQLATLQHQGLVRIIDSVYTEDGKFYLIYDTPFEGTLADVMAKVQSFPEKQVIYIINELGKTLDFIHQHKIAHGGINPENIDLLANGQLKLRNLYIDDLLNSFVLTQGRSVLDPTYLSPEQLRGEKTTKTSDIFALGVLSYVLLSGHKPWPEITSIAMLLKNYQKPPEKLTLRNSEIPKYLEDIIEKALQNKPSLRQQSVLEFLGDLRNKKVTISVEELKRREKLSPPTPPISEPPEEIDLPPLPPRLKREPNNVRITRTPMVEKLEKMESLSTAEKPLQNSVVRKIIWYVLTGVFAAVIFLFGYSLFISYFEAVPKVEVPFVAGLPLNEAERLLEERGLRPKVVAYVVSDKVSPNYVIESDPEGGRVVKKYRIIRLFVCKQNEDIAVPDLVERSLTTAEAILKEKGLVLKETERVYSNRVLRNQIIKQHPAPGTPIRKGEEVIITVSDGYPVNLQVLKADPKKMLVKVTIANEKDWDPQNVFIYTQTESDRQKRFEKLLQPGEKKEVELEVNPEAVVEVYYFNDLAYKQELKYLIERNRN